MPPKRYSDLQKKCLMFYRDYLKFAKTKEDPMRQNIQLYARETLERLREVPKRNYMYCELVLRQESQKLSLIKQSGVDNVSMFTPKSSQNKSDTPPQQ
eukprot:403359776